MRGRSSSAKSRLRSAGYKCNLCGRRVIDAATLERHQKTIHNVSPRYKRVSFKAKPMQRRSMSHKDREKTSVQRVKEEIVADSKPKFKNNKHDYENVSNSEMGELGDGDKVGSEEILPIKNGESKKENPEVTRRVQFECPVCVKRFSVYFTAHKHIQKVHSVNAEGKKVPPNSVDLVQPIRVEYCYRCDSKMKSNEHHACPKVKDETVVTTEFMCTGCNQIFVSLKTFDMHVAGLHSDSMDSMFFPTKIEFMSWRLDMERQTNAKYLLYGEYESKKVYRCSYAKEDGLSEKSTAYFCPSSMVVQDFSKGIQVHFYNKHHDHLASPYALSSKYTKYSITTFLKHPIEESVKSVTNSMKMDDKDLHSQFKKLMDGIVLNSTDVDVVVLRRLIEKALEMSTVLTDAAGGQPVAIVRHAKSMSDKEIIEALETNSQKPLRKRRRSVESCETHPKAAKRTRNKSLFNQSDEKMSPKIVNTFSLASNSTNEVFKSNDDYGSTANYTNVDIGFINNENVPEHDAKTNKSTKMSTRLSSFNESLSFNDSYKDFIDRNFIGKADGAKEPRSTRNTVKTKLGAFKQTSPRRIEDNDDITYDTAMDKNIRGITSFNAEVEEADVCKGNAARGESPKVNILSVETPNMNVTKGNKIISDNFKTSNSQLNISRTKSSKTRTFSHTVDPLQVNIKKLKRRNPPSPVDLQGDVSISDASVPTPLVDPLELNITDVKTRSSSILVEPIKNHATKAKRVASPSDDPLTVNTNKINLSKIDTSKLNATKVETTKLKTLKVCPSKMSSPKVYTGPRTPKLNNPAVTRTPKVNSSAITKTSKVRFEDKINSGSSSVKVTAQKKIKELKYEVREQENDCNILVLKF